MTLHMLESAWEIPFASRPPSEEGREEQPDQSFQSPLPESTFAPVVLSQPELNYILGTAGSESSSSIGYVSRRICLSEQLLYSNTNFTSSAEGATHYHVSDSSVARRSASSSFCSNASYGRMEGLSKEGNNHLDFVKADDLNTGKESRTTFMVRRLPRYLTSEQVLQLLNRSGYLQDSADLIYVPVFTGKAHANRGYAFINFKSPQLGALFLTVVQHSSETELSRQLGRCDIVYAHIQTKEGMLANLMRIRQEPFLEELSVPPGLLVLD